MLPSQIKIAKTRNNKLIVYTLIVYSLLAFNVLGSGGCKWNSDYRSRIQPMPPEEQDPLSAEEASLQDAINESEPDSLKEVIPGKRIPEAPNLPE